MSSAAILFLSSESTTVYPILATFVNGVNVNDDDDDVNNK